MKWHKRKVYRSSNVCFFVVRCYFNRVFRRDFTREGIREVSCLSLFHNLEKLIEFFEIVKQYNAICSRSDVGSLDR